MGRNDGEIEDVLERLDGLLDDLRGNVDALTGILVSPPGGGDPVSEEAL